MLVKGEDKALWFMHVLHLFHLNVAGVTSKGGKQASVQHFEVTELKDEVEIVFYSLFLRWATEDEMDHNLHFNLTPSAVVDIGEWCGPVPFTSVKLIDLIVTSNHFVLPFYLQKQQPTHRYFSIDSISRKKKKNAET